MKKTKLPTNNPDILLESSLLKQGYSRVIGIDEAGRGCWAGPVAVGAYIFSVNTQINPAVKDSKLVSPAKRVAILASFKPDTYEVILTQPEIIDQKGIAVVIMDSISAFIEKYDDGHTFFLIDGQFSKSFGNCVKKIIKGDRKHYSIAAASIAAKVTRDDLMSNLDITYPGYEFAKHKGYGTKLHLDLLLKNGVSTIHRRSFAPVKDLI